MAQHDPTRLRHVAQAALLDEPDFLRELVQLSCHKDRETLIPVDAFSPCDVDAFIDGNVDLRSKTNEHTAGWIEDGLVYLDVSCVVTDLETAVALGHEHHQITVWDFQTCASVYVWGLKVVLGYPAHTCQHVTA